MNSNLWQLNFRSDFKAYDRYRPDGEGLYLVILSNGVICVDYFDASLKRFKDFDNDICCWSEIPEYKTSTCGGCGEFEIKKI